MRLSLAGLGTLVALLLAEGAFWWAQDGAFPHLNLYKADANRARTIRALLLHFAQRGDGF